MWRGEIVCEGYVLTDGLSNGRSKDSRGGEEKWTIGTATSAAALFRLLL